MNVNTFNLNKLETKCKSWVPQKIKLNIEEPSSSHHNNLQCLYRCMWVRTWVDTHSTDLLRWQGVSITINRQTRQLSHAITLHYGSQGFKVKMNGSSSTWRLHISSFFLDTGKPPATFCCEDHVVFFWKCRI